MTTQQTPSVTQADRDEAARTGLDMARINERDAEALRQGGAWDEWSLVQAFARHREAAEAASKAREDALREALFELLDCHGVMTGHDFELGDLGIGPLRCAEMRRLAKASSDGGEG